MRKNITLISNRQQKSEPKFYLPCPEAFIDALNHFVKNFFKILKLISLEPV